MRIKYKPCSRAKWGNEAGQKFKKQAHKAFRRLEKKLLGSDLEPLKLCEASDRRFLEYY